MTDKKLDLSLIDQPLPPDYERCTRGQHEALGAIREAVTGLREVTREERESQEYWRRKGPNLTASDAVTEAVYDITDDTRPIRSNRYFAQLEIAVRRAVELGMIDIPMIQQYAEVLGIRT